MEGHWEFLGGGGLKAPILEANMKLSRISWGGGGCKPKTLHGGEHGNSQEYEESFCIAYSS